MAGAGGGSPYDYEANEEEVTARQAQTGSETETLLVGTASGRATHLSIRGGQGQATPTNSKCSTRRRAVTLATLLAIVLFLAGIIAAAALAGTECKGNDTHTAQVVMAWNQTVTVFRQRGSGERYSGVDVVEVNSGQAAQEIELYVSSNLSTYVLTKSVLQQLTLYPQWYDILPAQYILKSSTLSYNFSLPENTSLPLFILNSFHDYHQLKGGGHPRLLHHWNITQGRNSVSFEVDKDCYIFVVVNITAYMEFNVTSHESLHLYTPPASYLSPVCTLITFDLCHIKLSTHSTVVGVATPNPLGQDYPTVSTSVKWGTPKACVTSLIVLGVLMLSALTLPHCIVLVYCCWQKGSCFKHTA